MQEKSYVVQNASCVYPLYFDIYSRVFHLPQRQSRALCHAPTVHSSQHRLSHVSRQAVSITNLHVGKDKLLPVIETSNSGCPIITLFPRFSAQVPFFFLTFLTPPVCYCHAGRQLSQASPRAAPPHGRVWAPTNTKGGKTANGPALSFSFLVHQIDSIEPSRIVIPAHRIPKSRRRSLSRTSRLSPRTLTHDATNDAIAVAVDVTIYTWAKRQPVSAFDT